MTGLWLAQNAQHVCRASQLGRLTLSTGLAALTLDVRAQSVGRASPLEAPLRGRLPVSSHARPSLHVCILISCSHRDPGHVRLGPCLQVQSCPRDTVQLLTSYP